MTFNLTSHPGPWREWLVLPDTTVREYLTTDGWCELTPEVEASGVWEASFENERRIRTVPAPVPSFAVPCPECVGDCYVIPRTQEALDAPDLVYAGEALQRCPRCEGRGTIDVLGWSEEQVLCPICGVDMALHPNEEEGCYYIDLTECPYYKYQAGGPHGLCSFGCRDEPECVTCGPFEPCERRQVISSVSDVLGVLPVVGNLHLPERITKWEASDYAIDQRPGWVAECFVVVGDRRFHVVGPSAAEMSDAPELVDLEPGQRVLHLGPPRPLEQPITDRACEGDGRGACLRRFGTGTYGIKHTLCDGTGCRPLVLGEGFTTVEVESL